MRTFMEFQSAADRVADKSHELMIRQAIAVSGIVEESTEILGYMRKVVGHGHPFDRSKLIEEMGDLLWQIAETATSYGLHLARLAGDRTLDAFQEWVADGAPSSGDIVDGVRLSAAASKLASRMADQLEGGPYLTGTDVEDWLRVILQRLCLIAKSHGVRLSEIAGANEAKMRVRYPDGFTSEASQARVDTAAGRLAFARGYLNDWLANLHTRPVAIAAPPEIEDLIDELGAVFDAAFR